MGRVKDIPHQIRKSDPKKSMILKNGKQSAVRLPQFTILEEQE
jgi:hypothetical protein